MLNIVIKSFLIVSIIFISSCFQVEEYKYNFFSDEEDISTREDSFNYLSRNRMIKDNNIEYSFSNLTGTETIVEFTLENVTTISISYIKDLNRGELKTVLISPDNLTQTIKPGINILNCELPGKYRIRAISYDSTGRLALRYNK